MIIDVTFVYEAAIVAPRKRNAETRRYIATVPVEVPEIPSAELPLAFRYAEDRDHRDTKGHVREIHWTREMGHWQERLEFERDRRKETVTVTRFDAGWLESRADVRSEANWGYDRGRPFGLYPSSCTDDARGLGVIEADAGIARIVSMTRLEREASIREVASRMLLVDGRLFQPTSEPVYEASSSTSIYDRDDSCWLNITLADSHGVEGQGHYRADELDHMLASRSWRSEARSSNRIEVINPDAIRAPLPEMAVVCAASDVIRSLEDHLKEATKETFCAYADLRDVLAAYKAELASFDRDGESPPDAAELVATIHAAMPALASGNPYSVEWVTKRVDLATERYDARALAAEFSAPGL